MMNHWQQLLPVDQYRVTTKGILREYDRKIIAMLYQPLIGPLSMSLYFTLWSELEANRLWGEESNHYCLMNTMSLPLKEIYIARSKLEGIGLLKVYKKQGQQDETILLYELMAPLNPEQFFTDGMLNVYLYKKVGKSQFAKLKRFFSDDSWNVAEYKDETKSFTEVFSSQLDSLYVSPDDTSELEVEQGSTFISENTVQNLDGFSERFDFGLFFSGMQSSLIPKKAFTTDIQTAIAKLAFIYGINPIVMQSIVLRAVTVDNEIDVEELRKAARDWYQIEYNQEYPTLVEQVQPAKYKSEVQKPLSKEEERIQLLESISPRELLIQHAGGGEPSKADLQIVEEVMMKQKLSPGVMNVLLEYVMIMTDMKLSKAYVEKIAGQWSRKKVKTVKEAMELAKNEYKQAQERKAKGKTTYSKKTQKPVRTEIVPEWLKNNETKDKVEKVEVKSDEDVDFEAKKAELQAKLKEKYKRKG
ncbi:replication initiation and membrane attachment family protein [Bacillus massiliigorillae]|uniref:replication initiation and membrane attachment family protein n=1 Tax=Bacillus massiliigorillae TaxID=1243664 RepID=UPI00039B8CDB|nr:DnaD domain protein [Bacillus massiliigorillae]